MVEGLDRTGQLILFCVRKCLERVENRHRLKEPALIRRLLRSLKPELHAEADPLVQIPENGVNFARASGSMLRIAVRAVFWEKHLLL